MPDRFTKPAKKSSKAAETIAKDQTGNNNNNKTLPQPEPSKGTEHSSAEHIKPPTDPEDKNSATILRLFESILHLAEKMKSTDSILPDFPDFDNTWPEEVKLQWLGTYKDLVVIANSRDNKKTAEPTKQ
jgi:hypothetical protein